MIKFLLFVIMTIIMINFIQDCYELHKQEIKQCKDEIMLFLEKTFGQGKFKIFKSLLDDDGRLRKIIYLPHYEWFKSPQYQWYEVYATENGFHYNKMEK